MIIMLYMTIITMIIMMLMINILKSFFAQTQLSEILVTISELNKEKTEEKAVMKS